MDLIKPDSQMLDQQLSLLRKHWQLTLELCHFTSELNPLWPTKVLQRKVIHLFLSQKKERNKPLTPIEKWNHLREFFFAVKNFSILPDEEQKIENSLLPYVLSSRKGPPELLMILFCVMAEFMGLKIQCHVRKNRFLLKIIIDEKPLIADFYKQARFLERHEIVELINEGIDFSKDKNHCRVIIRYLQRLNRMARKERHLTVLSHTHSFLMKYQPFNLKHVSERAKVAYITGDFRTAITDIRSYFLYKSPGMNSPALAKIYRLALKKQRDT